MGLQGVLPLFASKQGKHSLESHWQADVSKVNGLSRSDDIHCEGIEFSVKFNQSLQRIQFNERQTKFLEEVDNRFLVNINDSWKSSKLKVEKNAVKCSSLISLHSAGHMGGKNALDAVFQVVADHLRLLALDSFNRVLAICLLLLTDRGNAIQIDQVLITRVSKSNSLLKVEGNWSSPQFFSAPGWDDWPVQTAIYTNMNSFYSLRHHLSVPMPFADGLIHSQASSNTESNGLVGCTFQSYIEDSVKSKIGFGVQFILECCDQFNFNRSNLGERCLNEFQCRRILDLILDWFDICKHLSNIQLNIEMDFFGFTVCLVDQNSQLLEASGWQSVSLCS